MTPGSAAADACVGDASPARTGGGRISRDQLIAFGREWSSRAFLPVAAQALVQIPGDHALRLLFAAHLARLGLATLATEQLEAIPPQGRDQNTWHALHAAAAKLGDDRADCALLHSTCDTNLTALRSRGICLQEHLTSWQERRRDWFRTNDGRLVHRSSGDPDPRRWRGLDDAAQAAAHAAATLLKPTELFPKPFVIGGIDPPDHLQLLWSKTNTHNLGYTPWISVVQPDLNAFLDGCACANLTAIIHDERVEWFVGEQACDRFAVTWNSRPHSAPPECIVTPPGTNVDPTLHAALQTVHQHREAAFACASARMQARYAARTPAWWASRYSTRAPKRVLVLTSRFSTYIRHAAADLALGFELAGHTSHVYVEPDAHSRPSPLGMLTMVDEFDPDLVTFINIPRSYCKGGIPTNIPYVCWVQDAMPQLFTPGIAGGQLDFVAGHVFNELFEKFGYDPRNAMPAMVSASSSKFHPAPVDPAMRDSFSCDIAMMSHHSETPEAMHERLVRESSGAPAIQAAFANLRRDVLTIASEAGTRPACARLREAALHRLRESLGREPEDRTLTLVLRNYAQPLADRAIRHETVAWAADIAEQTGARLHLYGRGWDKHPRFARYARGELSHGEDLRAAYQCAAVTLQTTIHSPVHQRVLECFLSGGLCACRMHMDAAAGPKTTTQMSLISLEPDLIDQTRDMFGYTIADHPQAMAFAALRGRMGIPLPEPVLWIPRARVNSLRGHRGRVSGQVDLGEILGDAAATTFWTKADLLALLNQCATSPAWRTAHAEMAARRIRRVGTHESLAQRLIDFISRRLNESTVSLKEAA